MAYAWGLNSGGIMIGWRSDRRRSERRSSSQAMRNSGFCSSSSQAELEVAFKDPIWNATYAEKL